MRHKTLVSLILSVMFVLGIAEIIVGITQPYEAAVVFGLWLVIVPGAVLLAFYWPPERPLLGNKQKAAQRPDLFIIN